MAKHKSKPIKRKKAKKRQKKAVQQQLDKPSRFQFHEWASIKSPATNPQWANARVFWAIATLMLVFAVFSSWGTGINGDEFYQMKYEKSLINYYQTGGEDTTALYDPNNNLHLYGGVFELLSGTTSRILGYNGDEHYNTFQVRHFYTSLFGIIAIVAIALLIQMIAGWPAALMALLIGFLIPRFLGHAMMNPKDVPFAAGYALSLLFSLRFLHELPKPSWRTLMGLSIGLAIALGVRAGGLLVFAYFGLFAGMHFLLKHGIKQVVNWSVLRPYLQYGLIAVIAGLTLAIVCWPFALQAPLTNIKVALDTFSNYTVNLNLLYDGQLYRSQSLPWHYLFRWLLITSPIALFAGVILQLILSLRPGGTQFSKFAQFALWFAFIFPIGYILYSESTLYDGLRHILFVLPVLAGLAALGFERMRLAFLENKYKYSLGITLGIIVFLSIDVVVHYAKNNSLMYVYFNPTQGGLANVYGKYELDYWGIALKDAAKWLKDEQLLAPKQGSDNLNLATTLAYPMKMYLKEYQDEASVFYLSPNNRYGKPWDYGVYNTRFLHPTIIKHNWPPPQAIHSISRNGVPLASILKNDQAQRLTTESRATNCANLQEMLSAYESGQRGVEFEEAMANCLLRKNNQAEAEKVYKSIIAENEVAIESYRALATIYLNQGKIQEAVDLLMESVNYYEDRFDGWYYLAIGLQALGRQEEAFSAVQKSLKINPNFTQGYTLGATLAKQTGRNSLATRYEQIAQQLSQMNK